MSSLYQFKNVCSIAVDESVAAAAACAGCVCVCEGCRLHVKTEKLAVFTFGHVVDAVTCWRGEETCVVAAGDRNGSLHVLSPALQSTLYSQVVESPVEACSQPVFSALHILPDEGFLCLLAVTMNGSLYFLKTLPLHKSTSGGPSGTEDMEFVQLEISSVHADTSPLICTLANIAHVPHVLTARGGPWPLALWRLEKKQCPQLSALVATILSDRVVVQAESAHDGSYIVTRTEQYEVQVWLVEVMVVVAVWGGRNGQPRVSQFSLYCHGGLHRLCMLCHNQDQCNQQLIVVSLPGMKQVYCTQVAPSSLLAVGSGQESVCVLQPEQSRDGACVCVITLEYEAPEERITVLVSQGKFEEAEQLVREHHLDPEFVVYEKAAMLNGLVCAGKEEHLPSLLQCLTRIKDVRRVADLVLESQYLSLTSTYSVLTAVCTELAESDSNTAQDVATALDRLTTFTLLASQDNFCCEDWHAFRSSSCLQVLHHLLQSGQTGHAKLFWTRHQIAVQHELATLDIHALAQLMPTDLSTAVTWLSATILPYVLAHTPHQMGEFLVELKNMLCSLEYTDADNWPSNALSLTDQLLASISEMCAQHQCPPDVSPLMNLQEKLIKLTSVLAIVQCPLSLLAFEQSSTEQLVYHALDQATTPASLRHLITDKLSIFILKQHLSLDTMLSNYLKLFLARAPTHSPDFTDSPWEAKAVTLIRSVTCSVLRVACCVELLHHVSLPWSETAAGLIHDCLLLDTANAGELQSLHDLLQLKAMLHDRYGVTDFNFSDANTGHLYIRHILLQAQACVLADALRVAAKYSIAESKVYLFHLFNLCCQDQTEEAKGVLDSLTPEIRTSTAHATLSFCLHRLKLPHLPGLSDPASHCGAAQLAVLSADVLCLPADWSGECTAEQLRQVRDLAVDFSLFLSPQQLTSPQHTSQLLQHSLAAVPPPSTGHCIPCKTVRLGRLLGYSEHEVRCQLVELWLQQTAPTTLAQVKMCPAHLTLPLLYSALCASDWPSLTPAVARCLCSLTMHISATCAVDQLERALKVFRACSFLSHVLSLCELGQLGWSNRPWSWAARLSEQGLQLELAQIRPTCLLLTAALLEYPQHTVPATRECCSSLVEFLRSHGHLCLTHHTAVQCQLFLGTATASGLLLTALLEKVLSTSRVDHSYGLALLLAIHPQTAIDLLHSRQASILSSYSRVIALSMLTTDYCQLVCMPQVRETAMALLIGAVWGKLLRTYQVNFSAAFKGNNEEKRRVLPQLLRMKDVPLHVILAYCRTYGLDEAGAQLTRLRVALTEWDSGYEEACEATMAALRSHRYLPTLFNTFLTSKVCPYDYERIRFVLLHLERGHHNEKMQLLLSLLVTYNRCCLPTAEERVWHSSHCHSVCRADSDAGQPDTSAHRLPLHILLETQAGLKLIAHEVQQTSAVARLAPIAHLMEVPENQFYCTVLQSLVTIDTSHLTFCDLSPLLVCVSDVATRLSLTTQLAQQLSSDADKVAALEAALCLLQEQNLVSEEGIIDKEELQYRLCEARARLLLAGAGLGQEWQMAGDVSLIASLYTELPLQEDKPAPSRVHKVAQNIADLHSVNVLTLTSPLLEEWLLPPTTSHQDLNTTLVREVKEVEVEKTEDSSGPNWMRMVYLLTDNPNVQQLAALLCRWAKADSPLLTPATRTRAMQLLLTAVPHSVVESVTGGALTDLREQTQCAVFVVELAAVQVSLTAEAFQACSKQSLASSLLHSRADIPRALRLVVDLCLHYRLADPALWVRLLDALLTLKMTGFLQNVLLGVVGLGAGQISNLSSVWQAVVQAPYEAGGGKDCLNALQLLYQCPVLFQLDLRSIAQTMAWAGTHSHALSTCLLMPPTLRASTVEWVMAELPAGGLIELLDEVMGSCRPELSLVANEVYAYVDKHGQHEYLLGSPHFPRLVQYLISRNSLTSLLHQTLTRGRVAEAVQLVEMYHTQHNSFAPHGMDGLKVHLEELGVLDQWDSLITD